MVNWILRHDANHDRDEFITSRGGSQLMHTPHQHGLGELEFVTQQVTSKCSCLTTWTDHGLLQTEVAFLETIAFQVERMLKCAALPQRPLSRSHAKLSFPSAPAAEG